MPYQSKAQRGKFHAMEARGAISHATVTEWDAASKGKRLPARVHRKSSTPSRPASSGHEGLDALRRAQRR